MTQLPVLPSTRSSYLSSPRFLPGLALASVLLLGWILRGIYILGPDLPPGANGGYYPVQARAILRTGWPALPDLPLLFYLQALTGWALSWFMSLEHALVLATRLTDTFLPVLIAIPVYWYAREFAEKERYCHTWASATFLTGLAAVGNHALLRMAGDFQKNTVALPLFLFYAYYMYMSHREPGRKNYLLAMIFLVLIGLTHLGVTGLTLSFTGLYLLIGLAARKEYQKIGIAAVILSAILAATLFLASYFDPVRVGRLAFVMTYPYRLLSQSVLLSLMAGRGGGPAPEIGGYLLGNALILLGLGIVFRRRDRVEPVTLQFLETAGLCALFLCSPLIHFDISSRLVLMAHVPALVLMAFIVARYPWGWKFGLPAAAVVVAGGLLSMLFGPPMSFSRDEYQELKQFRDSLPEGKTLAVARHGLEWWVAWTMETRITNQANLAVKTWNQYDAVVSVEETITRDRPENRPPGPPRPEDREPVTGPPGRRPLDRPEGPGGSGKPGGPGGPGSSGPGGPGGPSPFFPRSNSAGGDPMREAVSDFFTKEQIREGRFFRLYRLRLKASSTGERQGWIEQSEAHSIKDNIDS
ncbi:MAG: hypothetical protein ACE15F_18975 [bacterium]